MKKRILALTLFLTMLMSLTGCSQVAIFGKRITVAPCIVTADGSVYMVYDERPILIEAGEEADYLTGDKLFIIHSASFSESYPEQAKTVYVRKLESGTKYDIPQKALDALTDMGYIISGVMPKNTSLEFWITDNMEGYDWSGHEENIGWIGAHEFLGSGYTYAQDSNCCVEYLISAWPDYAGGGSFVTNINITDPTVTVYGLTVESSFDDFDEVFGSMGYELSWASGAIKTRVAKSCGITFSLTCSSEDNPQIVPKIRITADITNREGIDY